MNRKNWFNKLTLNVIFSGALFLATTTLKAQVTETVKTVISHDSAAKVVKPRKGTSQGLPDAQLNYVPGKPIKSWSIATAESVMARYPDYRDAYWKPWSYVQGYMFGAFERLYKSTGDKRYMDFIKKYIDNFVDEKGNFHGDNLNSLDNLMTGSSIVDLYGYTHDERYKTAANQFRKVFDTYPRSADGQFWHSNKAPNMWIDGVFMGQMFLIHYGKVIGDTKYCNDEAAKQITICAKHLLKGETGLYLHAWTEKPEQAAWADPKTGLSPEVWSEGLGWFAVVTAELLAELPKNHPQYAQVKDIYVRLAAGLKRAQDQKTGGWFMIVDKGDQPDNWIDPSGTGMFVYFIQRGIDLGLIKKSEYAPVVANGYKSLITFGQVNDHGLVDVVGGGDGITIKKDYATYVHYKKMVNAKETVGAFLWGTAIVEKPKSSK
jgi:unsaturated rhamnogalacturonyl hydrolase